MRATLALNSLDKALLRIGVFFFLSSLFFFVFFLWRNMNLKDLNYNHGKENATK